jgi:hypothetical protein
VSEILPFRQAPEGVEVKHLRAFVTVAEELNFGAPPRGCTFHSRR